MTTCVVVVAVVAAAEHLCSLLKQSLGDDG